MPIGTKVYASGNLGVIKDFIENEIDWNYIVKLNKDNEIIFCSRNNLIPCDFMQTQCLNIPDLKERIETGPLKINKDWSGTFIRGDDCANYYMNLKVLLDSMKDSTIFQEDFSGSLIVGQIESLLNLLESSREN